MTALDQPTPGGYSADQYAFAAGTALLAGLYLFSPLVAYIATLLYLTVFSERLTAPVRISAAVIAILSGASIWASRGLGQSMSDDFQQYYDIYSQIDAHGWTTGVIPSYELGLPAFFKMISLASPTLTPSGLMFVVTATAGLIFLFYVERFGLQDFPRGKKGYGIAMIFLFFSFVMVTQLTRQMLSSVLLVCVFFLVRPAARRFSLLLASVVHVSAIAIHIVLRLLQRRLLVIPLLAVIVVVLVRFINIETVVSMVSGFDLPRLGYYFASADAAGNRATLSIVLLVTVAGALSLLVLKLSRQTILQQERREMALLIGVVVVYLLTLNITLVPFRLFLVIHAVMAGWFFAYFTRRFPTIYLVIGGVALILYRTRTLYVIDPASAFIPWHVYGAVSSFPGYFFLSYLSS